MIRTDNFVKALSEKGFVDDAVFLENGYDIQYKGSILSVRLNNKGGALLFNQKTNKLFEVCSGRLDEVLHKYIIQSLFGTQNKVGVKSTFYKNTFFIPTKIVSNTVIFEDSVGRKYAMDGNSPEAVLSYFDEARNVNADDCMILLSNFKPYRYGNDKVTSSVETPDVEVQLLKSSVNPDDFAVSPNTDCINDVGQTIVGNFLCSSSDKWNYITFDEDVSKMFAFGSTSKRITSSVVRSKDPIVIESKAMFSSKVKIVSSYLDRKFPNGLCVSALEGAIAYEGPMLCKEAGITNSVDYTAIFNKYLKNCDSVQFRLDSNKSILCAVSQNGKSVARFRAVPVLSEMRSDLQKEGYLLTELESGIEFNRKETAVKAIVNSCKEFVPVVENTLVKPNTVERVIGSECKDILSSYGIRDKKGVFSSFYQITLY